MLQLTLMRQIRTYIAKVVIRLLVWLVFLLLVPQEDLLLLPEESLAVLQRVKEDAIKTAAFTKAPDKGTKIAETGNEGEPKPSSTIPKTKTPVKWESKPDQV